MPSQTDVRDIQEDGRPKAKRRFDQRDWEYVAEYVLNAWDEREKNRADREKYWKDIDRQIAMEPSVAFKKLANGKIDPGKYWMSEMELPLQAQCLEVLTADARRLMFSDDSSWFEAHAETTDAYYAKVDFKALILGDKSETPSVINQDNADKLVEGFTQHLFRQYDHYTRWDKINAEAFKYGIGVGRARLETKNVYIHEASGVRKETQRIPVIVPVSIKKLYLDDAPPSMHSSMVLGPGHICVDDIKFANLQMAANRGSTDPDDEDGGWMPDSLKQIVPDEDGYVRLLEWEGDLVIPRKTVRSLVIPGAIATVVVGKADNNGLVTRGVVRFRFRKAPYSSYLFAPYHYEGTDSYYPTSPLEKGRPVQMMATECLNRLLDSAALKNAPPVGYDRTDMLFAQTGGPAIHPYAKWGTTDPVTVHSEIGGDPKALQDALTLAIQLYSELTGVLPARLGAQTVSHTTAFAKDQEIQRGAARTADYVNATGHGPLTRWLHIAYDMARNELGKREKISFWIDAYGGYVEVDRDALPESASFEWIGAGGPQSEMAKMQKKLQSLQLALQMDQLNTQSGQPPVVDVPSAIREVLRQGGWTDIDVIAKVGHMAGVGARPPVPVGPGAQPQGAVPPANPGAAAVALQQLGLAGQGQ